jgi:hypothetical protein
MSRKHKPTPQQQDEILKKAEGRSVRELESEAFSKQNPKNLAR